MFLPAAFAELPETLESQSISPDTAKVKVAVIICNGMIDEGLYESIQRRTAEAIELGAKYVIYEIDTYGGRVDSADKIGKYLIIQAAKDVHTVAYINPQAISAGAMISVSCQDIIMHENASIGCSAPIVMGGKLEGVEREKTESFVRSTFSRAAEANNYPEALLIAMVSQQLEIFQLKNIDTGKYEYFETDHLPTDPNKYDIAHKKLIVKDDELLTLTASKAAEYGVARKVVKDLQGALDFLAERDSVIFSKNIIRLSPNWSEQMVRYINSPAVMGILVMLAMLGLYVEFNTPGLGLPGLVAVICLVIIVGSKYLVGMANWVEVAIFAVGLILLMIEIFIIPGFGIAGATGILCILVGMFGMLIKNPPERIPWPQTDLDWTLFAQSILGILFGFAGFLIVAWLSARFMPKVEFLSGLSLEPTRPPGENETKVSITSLPGTEEITVNIGDRGVVTSPLRPAGSAKFGDAVVDVLTRAEFMETGDHVEIEEVHGNRVVVKKIEN